MVPNTYHPNAGEDSFGNDEGAHVPGLELDVSKKPLPTASQPKSNANDKKNKAPAGRGARLVQDIVGGLGLAACAVVALGMSAYAAWGYGAPLESVLQPLAEEYAGAHPPYSTMGATDAPYDKLIQKAKTAEANGDLAGELLLWRRATTQKPADAKVRKRMKNLIEQLNAKGSLRGG